MKVARLSGRCSNGFERDRGRVLHALEPFAEFGPAICGRKPGRLSGGWVEPLNTTLDEVNCPRCRSKLRRLNANFQTG
jgi:hypothetical protein